MAASSASRTMIKAVFDEKGRLVSPIEYPLSDRWIVVDEEQLGETVESGNNMVPCMPWTAVKTNTGILMPALEFARQMNDRILFDKVLGAMERCININCPNDDEESYRDFFLDRLHGMSGLHDGKNEVHKQAKHKRRQVRASTLKSEWETFMGKSDLGSSSSCTLLCVVMPAFFNKWDQSWYIDLCRRIRFNKESFLQKEDKNIHPKYGRPISYTQKKINQNSSGDSLEADDELSEISVDRISEWVASCQRSVRKEKNKEEKSTIPDTCCLMNWTTSRELRCETIEETRDEELKYLLNKLPPPHMPAGSDNNSSTSNPSPLPRLLIGHGEGANAILRHLGEREDYNMQTSNQADMASNVGIVLVGAGYSQVMRELHENEIEFNQKLGKDSRALLSFNYTEIVKKVSFITILHDGSLCPLSEYQSIINGFENAFNEQGMFEEGKEMSEKKERKEEVSLKVSQLVSRTFKTTHLVKNGTSIRKIKTCEFVTQSLQDIQFPRSQPPSSSFSSLVGLNTFEYEASCPDMILDAVMCMVSKLKSFPSLFEKEIQVSSEQRKNSGIKSSMKNTAGLVDKFKEVGVMEGNCESDQSNNSGNVLLESSDARSDNVQVSNSSSKQSNGKNKKKKKKNKKSTTPTTNILPTKDATAQNDASTLLSTSTSSTTSTLSTIAVKTTSLTNQEKVVNIESQPKKSTVSKEEENHATKPPNNSNKKTKGGKRTKGKRKQMLKNDKPIENLEMKNSIHDKNIPEEEESYLGPLLEIVGLENQSDKNGCFGYATSIDEETDRYRFSVLNGHGDYLLKRENLRIVDFKNKQSSKDIMSDGIDIDTVGCKSKKTKKKAQSGPKVANGGSDGDEDHETKKKHKKPPQSRNKAASKAREEERLKLERAVASADSPEELSLALANISKFLEDRTKDGNDTAITNGSKLDTLQVNKQEGDMSSGVSSWHSLDDLWGDCEGTAQGKEEEQGVVATAEKEEEGVEAAAVEGNQSSITLTTEETLLSTITITSPTTSINSCTTADTASNDDAGNSNNTTHSLRSTELNRDNISTEIDSFSADSNCLKESPSTKRPTLAWTNISDVIEMNKQHVNDQSIKSSDDGEKESVRAKSGKTSSVQLCSSSSAPTPPPTATENTTATGRGSADDSPGMRVEIFDLKGKPELNGCIGTVKNYHLKSSRFVVELDNQIGTFRFKDENMRPYRESIGVKTVSPKLVTDYVENDLKTIDDDEILNANTNTLEASLPSLEEQNKTPKAFDVNEWIFPNKNENGMKSLQHNSNDDASFDDNASFESIRNFSWDAGNQSEKSVEEDDFGEKTAPTSPYVTIRIHLPNISSSFRKRSGETKIYANTTQTNNVTDTNTLPLNVGGGEGGEGKFISTSNNGGANAKETKITCNITENSVDVKVFHCLNLSPKDSNNNSETFKNYRFYKSPLSNLIVPELSKYKVNQNDYLIVKLRKVALSSSSSSSSSDDYHIVARGLEGGGREGSEHQISSATRQLESDTNEQNKMLSSTPLYADWTSLVKPRSSSQKGEAVLSGGDASLALLGQLRQSGSDQVKQTIDQALHKRVYDS